MLPQSLPHKQIAWFTVLFVLFGLVMLFSATGVLGLQKYGTEFHYVWRQSASAALGLGLMLLFAQVKYPVWGRIAIPVLAIQIALVLATRIPGIGHLAGGASRWLKIGPLMFQPSEMAKLSLTIYVAHVIARHREEPIPFRKWILYIAPVLALLVLILRQPDLGTTALLTVITFGILFIAGAKLSYLGGLLGVGGIIFIVSTLHSEYRRRRLFAFLNPWADPQGSGFQTIQSFLSIHSGQFFGVGLGNGNSKLFYLPEVHTDFIFALVGEELGFLGALLLLVAFAYFAYLLFKVAIRAKEPFGCYLAFGLALSLVLQICVNLGGVTGVLPVKGLTLPFISWGRSALLVNLAMIGILLNIARSSVILDASAAAKHAK